MPAVELLAGNNGRALKTTPHFIINNNASHTYVTQKHAPHPPRDTWRILLLRASGHKISLENDDILVIAQKIVCAEDGR
jgi:hypothetical protein